MLIKCLGNLIQYRYTIFYIFVVINIVSCSSKKPNDHVAPVPSLKEAEGAFSVMTYNVENLFDMIDNGREYPLYKPFKHNWNHETLGKKISTISSVILASKPDILSLCEIENSNIGRILQKELNKHSGNYDYISASDIPYVASTCQIVLSRFPIKASFTHKINSKDLTFSRNILETDIVINNQVLKIFTVHWSSKRHPESKRMKEVEILKQRIDALPPGTDYIITGDFNSNYNECETFYTEGLDDTEHTTAINHILKTVLSGPKQCTRYVTERLLIQNFHSAYHYDLWLELPENKRFSYKYKGQFCTLDHILVPASMYDKKGISYVDNSFSVFYWDGRLLYNGVPLRWNIAYRSDGRFHTGKGYSDHLPVIAWFTPNPFESNDSELPDSKKKENSAPLKNSTFSGFETGTEGWVPSQASIRLFRDTRNPAQGKHCLKIEGMTRAHSSAARICLPIDDYDQGEKWCIKFAVYGTGHFTFRMRIDTLSWLYYTGSQFRKISRRNKYQYSVFSEWTPVILPVPWKRNGAKSIEIEIRSAVNKTLCIWLDNIQYSGTM